REHAVAGFYGQLAQAMTRDTFIGGEGSRFLHGDAQGRSFYLPPNSASNAMFLTTLRYLLVQDWDLDDDGKPDTLRLLYGATARSISRRDPNAPLFGSGSKQPSRGRGEGSGTSTITGPHRGLARVSSRQRGVLLSYSPSVAAP